MPDLDLLARLREELHDELTAHLLPFWARRTVDARGGFVGRITQDGAIVEDAHKGAVLNARILWTFAAAYRALGEPGYRALADRAHDYLLAHFWDAEHEGVYWSVDAEGRPVDTRKQVYAQAFALYALAEYHHATGDAGALDRAVRLFEQIERYAFDPVHGGYFEAFARDWGPLADVRLSEKDLNAPKSMNTLLHVLEAYTTLYRVWPDARLRVQLAALVDRFLAHVVDARSGHLRLFFEADWRAVSSVVSFGHDIEASWLLAEAADVLGDPALRARVREGTLTLARATLREGQDRDGALFNEVHGDGRLDTDKHWWPQAEAVVGFLHAYHETGDPAFAAAAVKAWDFVRTHLVDRTHGEWFGRVSRDGVPYAGEDKVGPWKCPYHNVRACLEGIARTEFAGASRP